MMKFFPGFKKRKKKLMQICKECIGLAKYHKEGNDQSPG